MKYVRNKQESDIVFTYLIPFFIFLCLVFSCPYTLLHSHAASTKYVNTQSLNVRSKASAQSNLVTSLPNGTKLAVSKTVTNKQKEKWYKISVKVKQTTYKGYVLSTYVSSKKPATTEKQTASSDASGDSNAANSTSQSTTGFWGYAKPKKTTALYKSQSTASAKKAYVTTKTLLYVGKKKKIGKTTWYYAKTKNWKKNYTGYIKSGSIQFQKTTVASKQYKVAIVTVKSGIYKKANRTTNKIHNISVNKDVIILGTLTVGNTKWAKCKTKYGTGYIIYSHLKPVTCTVKNTQNYEATVTKTSGTRKVASLLATNLGTVSVGTKLSVVGQLHVNKVLWYKVTWVNNDQTITGYIKASAVELAVDVLFATALNELPASYHAALTQLHTAHPTWIFKPVKTGLDWNTVIQNEDVPKRNTIQSNCPAGGKAGTYSAPFSYLSTNTGDYDWATDTYSLRDGTNWYTANREVISYYMDPRNFLNEQGIYQFEALSYESTQTEDVVKQMLSKTFMNKDYSITDVSTKKKVTGSYSEAFMTAATTNNISPYYLVTRVINEVGYNGSNSTSGTYKGYEGYYNFYNIGANDSSTGKAVDNGLSWAKRGSNYCRPWTTPTKAIVGGAEYIAGQYISLGQNTMYTQKFNVVVPASYYLHQYMTSVSAAASYASSSYNTYATNGLLNNSCTFYIPYYENMPETVCSLPGSSGNPNSYLKSITIKGASGKSLSLGSFSYKKISYTLSTTEESVTISATPVSSYASTGGTGTISLAVGANPVTITCTAGNGTKTKYSIVITRK